MVLLGLLIGLYLYIRPPFRSARTDLVTYVVRRQRLELAVVERGALESADNREIYCRVKAGTKNSTIATTIKSVIDDGSRVHKDDLLVELDDSGLIEQLKSEKIVLDQADAARVQAEENYKIVRSQNDSDVKTAEITLELAIIDLKKYQEGDFPQSLKDVEGRIKVAESDLEMQRDRSAWASRMVKKGYQTASQAQAELSKLESYDLALKKVLEEKRVLTDPSYGARKRTVTDLFNKVEEAKRAVDRVKSQATAKEVQAKTDRETKTSIHEQEATRYQEIKDEIKKCKIYAPQDGMVVYFVPEQARSGGGSQQSIVAQGEPVREGQKLMQLPNLDKMVVNTKVHEALISRVKRDQKARVRVDAFPNRVLTGKVDLVATISSQQDFLSADVKVYATRVAIEEAVEGLKPGMSAEVTISIGDPLESILTIPIQSIVGGEEQGRKRKCFVVTPNGPQERDIVLGQSNDSMAEVKDGLDEGDLVVENPKAIVGDRLKTRQVNTNLANDAPVAGKDGKPGKKAAEGKTDANGPKPGPGGPPSAEDRQRQLERFRTASPEERKQMLERIPESFRDRVRDQLRGQGIDVPQ